MATFVQATTAVQGGSPASASFASAVTAGNLVIVSGNISGVTDNQGNTYHLAATQAGYSAGVAIYYAYNVVASGTFTVTPTTVSVADWVAEEWGGFGVADPLAGSGATSNSNPVVASPTTAASDGCAVVAVMSVNVGFPTGASGGNVSWTTRMNFAGFDSFSASGPLTGSGTISAPLTFNGGTNHDDVIAYFVNPDSGGSGSITFSKPTIDGTGDVYNPPSTPTVIQEPVEVAAAGVATLEVIQTPVEAATRSTVVTDEVIQEPVEAATRSSTVGVVVVQIGVEVLISWDGATCVTPVSSYPTGGTPDSGVALGCPPPTSTLDLCPEDDGDRVLTICDDATGTVSACSDDDTTATAALALAPDEGDGAALSTCSDEDTTPTTPEC